MEVIFMRASGLPLAAHIAYAKNFQSLTTALFRNLR